MSNSDKGFAEEAVEAAKQRMARTVSGLDANNIAFFAETDRHKTKGSSDPDHLQQMHDVANAKFRK